MDELRFEPNGSLDRNNLLMNVFQNKGNFFLGTIFKDAGDTWVFNQVVEESDLKDGEIRLSGEEILELHEQIEKIKKAERIINESELRVNN